MPPSLVSSISKMVEDMTAMRDALIVMRDQYRDELAKLTTQSA
jgi:hypothetical protein